MTVGAVDHKQNKARCHRTVNVLVRIDMKVYCLESRSTYYGAEFRFRSLYNGTIGVWRCGKDAKDDARKDGEDHKALLAQIHGVDLS